MSLNDFEVIRRLGEGAYSSVYQVKRHMDQSVYALKKVKMEKLSDKEKENALNEVRILASIQHPSISYYYEAFIDEPSQSLCIVMEFADHGDLFQKITRHQKEQCYFKEEEVWRIFIQIVKGLRALHYHKILHRDLKSANVFLNKNGTAKLGDMNVSKVAKKGLLYTQTGTPYYASPEVWRDQPYDYKSDIWSLGCVLYESVTLKPPFRADDMAGLYKRVLKGVYPKIPSHFSQELSETIKTLVCVQAQMRPNCQEILEMPVVRRIGERIFGIDAYWEDLQEFANGSSQNNNNASKNNSGWGGSQMDLLKTICVPKNLLYLTDRLPKPKYDSPDRERGTDSKKYATSGKKGGVVAPGMQKGNQSSRKLEIDELKRRIQHDQQQSMELPTLKQQKIQAQKNLDTVEGQAESVQSPQSKLGNRVVQQRRKSNLNNQSTIAPSESGPTPSNNLSPSPDHNRVLSPVQKRANQRKPAKQVLRQSNHNDADGDAYENDDHHQQDDLVTIHEGANEAQQHHQQNLNAQIQQQRRKPKGLTKDQSRARLDESPSMQDIQAANNGGQDYQNKLSVKNSNLSRDQINTRQQTSLQKDPSQASLLNQSPSQSNLASLHQLQQQRPQQINHKSLSPENQQILQPILQKKPRQSSNTNGHSLNNLQMQNNNQQSQNNNSNNQGQQQMALININSEGNRPVGPLGLKKAEQELIKRRYKQQQYYLQHPSTQLSDIAHPNINRVSANVSQNLRNSQDHRAQYPVYDQRGAIIGYSPVNFNSLSQGGGIVLTGPQGHKQNNYPSYGNNSRNVHHDMVQSLPDVAVNSSLNNQIQKVSPYLKYSRDIRDLYKRHKQDQLSSLQGSQQTNGRLPHHIQGGHHHHGQYVLRDGQGNNNGGGPSVLSKLLPPISGSLSPSNHGSNESPLMIGGRQQPLNQHVGPYNSRRNNEQASYRSVGAKNVAQLNEDLARPLNHLVPLSQERAPQQNNRYLLQQLNDQQTHQRGGAQATGAGALSRNNHNSNSKARLEPIDENATAVPTTSLGAPLQPSNNLKGNNKKVKPNVNVVNAAIRQSSNSVEI